MAIRIPMFVLAFACFSAAQTPEIDMIFFRAYYLEHREKNREEANTLYSDYLQKAPSGRYAAQAEMGRQRIAATSPAALDGSVSRPSVKIPRDARLFGQRRLARIEKMETSAKSNGRFLQAARLRSRQCYLSVISNAATGIISDDQELAQLVNQRNTHLAFDNAARAGEVTRQIQSVVLRKNSRTAYSSVRSAMMARERADHAAPGSSFCVFLYDMTRGADPLWIEQIARFRTWLGDAAASPDADASEVAAARAISHDTSKALTLIDGGKLKEAQAILDQIWNWSVLQ